MSWRELDLLKFRVDKILFSDLAKEFHKALGMSAGKLRQFLAELGVTFGAEEDPELFYVVVQEAYEDMKADQRREPTPGTLFGISPSVALTEEMARHRFEVKIKNHNEALS
jgi:alkanesulfonate monooxygenase SsuD/methylene tetrahydromethanopterin reductase-like flavin-dependent oxidoreductase (luciferase family)